MPVPETKSEDGSASTSSSVSGVGSVGVMGYLCNAVAGERAEAAGV
jgi:hypothetical protein